MRLSIAFTLVTAPLLAQQPAGTIKPGMSRVQVIAALGEPIATRSMNDYTYIFYKNSCGKQCGMNDIVTLRRDSVVDAIFRAPSRHYTGASTSPAAISPKVAAQMKATPPRTDSVAPRRLVPGPPNDTRPSIPLNTQPVRPAPTSP